VAGAAPVTRRDRATRAIREGPRLAAMRVPCAPLDVLRVRAMSSHCDPGVYDACARAIQAWQQDWPRKLAYSARQRRGQLTWDHWPGSYLKESWSLVRKVIAPSSSR
jgi:hypothetical protein